MNNVIEAHPNHGGAVGMEFPGIYVETDFISTEEEKSLVNGFDGLDWDISQSGRRKQVSIDDIQSQMSPDDEQLI